MDLTPLLTSRVLAAIGLACLVLSGIANLWGIVKLAYQKVTGRPMPRTRLTMTLDVIAEVANNIVGAISRATKLRTGESLFQATVPRADEVDLRSAAVKPPEPIAPRSGQSGHVDPRALLAIVFGLSVVVPLGVALMGCPSVTDASLRLAHAPTPGDCRPLVQRCMETPDGLVPVVCSPVADPYGHHREWPALPRAPEDGRQRTCSHGCVVDADSGIAHCTGLATDGGL